jgi:hypothetical protein
MTSQALGSDWDDADVDRKERKYRRRACGHGSWRPFETFAMVLGFIVFWPIGLAILGYVIWRRSQGVEAGIPAWVPRIGPLARSTGNSAFEDWKKTELDRLEEERRKLMTAQQEFETFLGNLKRAKDREEFDRFLGERGKPSV